ncbi:MAG: OsmC family protein [Betaproteobacteria bacterium]|nr:OsmC family protein [Betaproteobacteria bacterium]
MSSEKVAAALQRMRDALERRPQFGPHDDAPAVSVWQGGLGSVASHANGTAIPADMPSELGGGGKQVSPGWLFRAGMASCAVSTIAIAAASAGVELTLLEVRAGSRSDTRGILGMDDENGAPVFSGPSETQLQVKIAADGIAPEKLRALVEDAIRRSPVPNAVQNAIPMSLSIEVKAN